MLKRKRGDQMQTFVRVSKLPNIVGRADYISNPERQEHIVLARSYADWKPYQEFERAHQKSSKANNEGRELIIALPNEWTQLSENDLSSRMNEMAQQILLDKLEYQWAVHWNKSHTNLHVHLIFSERDRQNTNSREVWDRDIYLTQDGKVARRKADRAVDRNGLVKPPVHRKGELKDGGKPVFSPKNKKFKSREWLNQTKKLVADFYRNYGITITECGLLHQYHEGKGKEAPVIRDKNKRIQHLNAFFKPFQEIGFVFPKPPTPEYSRMVKVLRHIPKTADFLDIACSIALERPTTTALDFPPEIEKPLRDKIHAAGLKVIRHKDPKTQQLFAVVPFQHANTLQHIIDDLTQDALAAVKQSSATQPVDTAKIIALRDDYARKHSVFSYLETASTSTVAQQTLVSAKTYYSDFVDALSIYREAQKQYEGTFNPIKRLKLRSAYKAAEERLIGAIEIMVDKLSLRKAVKAESVDIDSASSMKHLQAVSGKALQSIEDSAKEEIARNDMIVSLVAENATQERVRASLMAFQRACSEIPQGQRAAVYKALCASPVPSFEFEDGRYLYKGKRMVRKNITRVVASLKPAVSSSQRNRKQEQTQDVVPRRSQDIGFHR